MRSIFPFPCLGQLMEKETLALSGMAELEPYPKKPATQPVAQFEGKGRGYLKLVTVIATE